MKTRLVSVDEMNGLFLDPAYEKQSSELPSLIETTRPTFSTTSSGFNESQFQELFTVVKDELKLRLWKGLKRRNKTISGRPIVYNSHVHET